ncbi:cysteine synthase family protein [Planotetraspora sp. A-T 1434]|uniref:cysteine synthase family protein n=1 Tax=Planotetraspora sp. A-T 1434 TaxID=2979219 RepID=UPI0021C11F4E|nr:cysteine synthase family protein [Planotetraspora sp. A-T 1434]MCT9932195.1 cysteine synthase family protein [Planotetraspora sp. A-T 1434]
MLPDWDAIGGTPVSEVTVAFHGREHRVLLKREWANPSGSVKDRTAAGLLRAMHAAEPLRPGTTVIESTSGNLGIALARFLNAAECRFIAVIDPKTPAESRRLLRAAGAELHLVDEPDGHGGYLLSRLRVVRDLCAAHPHYRWPDQYASPFNPLVHQRTTGPEIAAQGGPDLDAVYVAVSTGGTLAGISACIRPLGRPIRLVAVDAQSSAATSFSASPASPAAASSATAGAAGAARALAAGAGSPSARLVPGIGAGRPSSFLGPASYDRAVAVPDPAALAMCRMFLEDTGVALGGSSGSVLTACVEELGGPDPPRLALCLAADHGAKYATTVYDDGWLIASGVYGAVKHAFDRYRIDGLRFVLESGPF